MHEKNNVLFTVGQFAKMHHINKRTLHYYDEIGLFQPAHKGENGYRYYTYLQSTALEFLLTLRELGMSIEEITQYMGHKNVESLTLIFEKKRREIDLTIERLQQTKAFLQEKERQLDESRKAQMGSIQIEERDAEYLALSEPIGGELDEIAFTEAWLAHTQNIGECRLYHRNYGSMIHTKELLAGSFEQYACLYTKVDPHSRTEGLFCKPKGRYLVFYVQGDWDTLPQAYQTILDYVQQQGLTLTGYSYEEGLNEMAVDQMQDYITKIEIQIQE